MKEAKEKKPIAKRLFSMLLIAALLVPMLNNFAVTASASTSYFGVSAYAFDSNVSSSLKAAIRNRIFKEDFNGTCIDLSDLNIPNTTNNRNAVSKLISYGNPFDCSNSSSNVWRFTGNKANAQKALECQAVADKLLNGLDDKTPAQKAYLIHNRLILWCEYDYANYDANNIPDVDYTIYGALVNKLAVCAGYASAYMYLCNRAGVECYYVSGAGGAGESDHAWNVVIIGGTPYFVDTTWDDHGRTGSPTTAPYTTYFLKGQNYFGHTDFTFEAISNTNQNVAYNTYYSSDPGYSLPKVAVARLDDGYIYISCSENNYYYYVGTNSNPNSGSCSTSSNTRTKKTIVPSSIGTIYARIKVGSNLSPVKSVVVNNLWAYNESTHELTVTSLCPEDQTYCPWINYTAEIQTAVIQNGVSFIPDSAFNSSQINSISIPNSVTVIGNRAFQNCSSLIEINIPNSVIVIGDRAFQNCSNMIEISIPNSVTSIEDYAFSGCSNLTEINIPSGITSISDHAFYNCSGLVEIEIPNGVMSIGNSAFHGCSNLTNIIIPNTVTSIGNYAFTSCSGLTEITLPNSVTSIGDAAFWNCSNITSIIIPDSVTTMGIRMFSGCSSLADVKLSESISTLPTRTFTSCSSLVNITIPASVQTVSACTFMNCSSLEYVVFKNSDVTFANNAIQSCPNIIISYWCRGDANLDEDLTMGDVLLVRRFISGLEDLNYLQFVNADMDFDGEVDMADVLAMRRIIAGLDD